jgi:dienelactone hydrolase
MLPSRILFAAAMLAGASFAQDLPKGQIIDDVKCTADATQSYALYIPSNYTPDKKWNLLMAFDARARGRAPVERYQAAAEKFGYIVAGSNNSRNGPTPVSMKAARAMEADLKARFSIDEKRIYAAGQSGGARFVLDMVMNAKEGAYAGVIPSSAGFPRNAGSQLELPFAVFGTAGTEDFNYLELRRMERSVLTAHRVRIFQGGHTWLPGELAVEALEWMEVQAMRTGTRPRDEAMIDKLFAARKAELAAVTNPAEIFWTNLDISSEFAGLRDVGSYIGRAQAMSKEKDVVEAIRGIMQGEIEESRIDAEILNLSDQLSNDAEREECFAKLRTIITKLGADAHGQDDTPARRSARRVLYGVLADNNNQKDAEYKKLLESVRP